MSNVINKYELIVFNSEESYISFLNKIQGEAKEIENVSFCVIDNKLIIYLTVCYKYYDEP